MNTPTYKEQFDKLTRAYINNEVDPYRACACFVGNLLNRKGAWINCRSGFSTHLEGEWGIVHDADAIKCINEESNGLYTPKEIVDLEYLFLKSFGDSHCNDKSPEDSLFIAFEATLDLLKKIHISKGEVIDETPIFTKRTLANV